MTRFSRGIISQRVLQKTSSLAKGKRRIAQRLLRIAVRSVLVAEHQSFFAEVSAMRKIRLFYKKLGRAVYISHLDLMRTLQRAFLRAGYSLKYSEGFNPHPVISILLPLSVGASSECELMDFEEDERLTHAFSVFDPDMKESREVLSSIANFFAHH